MRVCEGAKRAGQRVLSLQTEKMGDWGAMGFQSLSVDPRGLS